ncbi:PREDICTED: uncharacterized protein LOC106326135 [Brassica oleracea var. oleracea]|uniref:uncharacterized protein LOC106326135 n=1 Tax=Brassica oleracea var. oleracea TaxID=109376 RepID=UPI0006A6D6BB|nr:PREDICTED: uncharacterized protein LOC106326135 [Brassica oleracea var. oleracea]
MRLKKSSTSTDVEHAHDLSNSMKGEKKRKKSTVHNANKDTEHSHKVKNVRASKKIAANHVAIDRLTSTIEDAYDEIIELRESIEEMTETMKKQQEILLTMAGTMKNLLVKETPKEKSTIKRECALARDYQPNNKHTILVKGYDPSMRRDMMSKRH